MELRYNKKMELAKKIFSGVVSKFNNRQEKPQLTILIFFIIGVLLILSMYFIERDPQKTEEQSGLLGYYLYFILYQLFGSSSYFVGPLLIVFSIKSFFSSDLKYLRNGIIGIVLFLFSSSSLLAILEHPNSGFAGEQLFTIGSFLLGKMGFLILIVIVFFISLFKMFSLRWQEFYDFLKNKEEKKISWVNLFAKLLPLLAFFITKNRDMLNKKNEGKSINSEDRIKTNTVKQKTMNFLKDIFKGKVENPTQKKMPWIQKVVIEESEDVNSELHLQREEIQKEVPISYPKEEAVTLSQSHESQDILIEEVLIKQEIEVNQLNDSKDNKKIKIYFDPQKDRFIFEDESFRKKKIVLNKDNGNDFPSTVDLLDKMDLDPEIVQEIGFNYDKKENQNISQEPLQVHEEENLIEDFREEEIPTIRESEPRNLEIQDTIIQEENHPNNEIQNTNLQEDEFSDIRQEKNDNDVVKIKESPSSYAFNPEYIHKKIQELQEQIISSENSNIPYRLSVKNLRLEQASFQVSSLSIQQEIQENWQKLEQVLSDYGIKGQVVGATRGPMITMYEVRLEPGVRVNRILNLQDEIRMNLAAISVRIVAPIPGKTTIGVEIPNKTREFVSLGELVHKDPEFFSKKRDINIPLGKDVAGKTRYIDLTRLPHLLIAGATGSGKSVFLNSVIASLLYQYSPEQIRFLMIDPKMVELKLYEGIPHLLYPVIIDVKLAEKALHWAVNEMENRYKLFSLAKCRDIRSYNEKVKKGAIKGNYIPYIVIIIDELSDLMMVSAREVEESIIRLTQKARAVGIHMILATQRPSVDVITALIKANCPARISFQVAQKVDSRIILDVNGAETLLGKGDMLYRSPATTLPIRIQAPNITEEEIEIIVQETQHYDFVGYIELPEEQEIDADFGFNQIDEDLIKKAWKIILETGKTSTSYIQRRLRIGYNRAANIMEKLEEMGYLSPAIGNKPREILRRD